MYLLLTKALIKTHLLTLLTPMSSAEKIKTREANVWGIKMALQDAKSNYQFNWKVNQSQVLENRKTNGYAANFHLAKISGKLRYSIEQNIESEKYNPNDLGFFYNSNEFNTNSRISYRIIQSF